MSNNTTANAIPATAATTADEVGFFGKMYLALTGPMAKAVGLAVVSAGAGAAGGYALAIHRQKGKAMADAPVIPKLGAK